MICQKKGLVEKLLLLLDLPKGEYIQAVIQRGSEK